MSENTVNQVLRNVGYDTSKEVCGHGCEYDLGGNEDLEVLYAGRGYGQDGERLASDTKLV